MVSKEDEDCDKLLAICWEVVIAVDDETTEISEVDAPEVLDDEIMRVSFAAEEDPAFELSDVNEELPWKEASVVVMTDTVLILLAVDDSTTVGPDGD